MSGGRKIVKFPHCGIYIVKLSKWLCLWKYAFHTYRNTNKFNQIWNTFRLLSFVNYVKYEKLHLYVLCTCSCTRTWKSWPFWKNKKKPKMSPNCKRNIWHVLGEVKYLPTLKLQDPSNFQNLYHIQFFLIWSWWHLKFGRPLLCRKSNILL